MTKQSGAGMIGGYAWRPWRAASQAQQFIKIESTQHSEDMNFIQRSMFVLRVTQESMDRQI
jgi:hypothetical protein